MTAGSGLGEHRVGGTDDRLDVLGLVEGGEDEPGDPHGRRVP